MKNLFFLLFLSFSLIACTSEEINDKNSIGSLNPNTSQIENQQDLHQNTQSNYRLPMFSVESDFVSVDGNGCFTINVRIYTHTSTTGTLLLINQNVQVCQEDMERGLNSDKNGLEEEYNCVGGTLLNGDKVLPSKLKNKYCLTEFLNNPEHNEVYGQYLIQKKKLLNNF